MYVMEANEQLEDAQDEAEVKTIAAENAGEYISERSYENRQKKQ